MTIRIDTLNNAKASLAADGAWGSMAVGEALSDERLSTEAANNLRAMQDTPVWGGVFVYDSMGPFPDDAIDALREDGPVVRTNVVGVAESWKGAKGLEGKIGAKSYSARTALNLIRDGRLVLDGNTTVLYDEPNGVLHSLGELQDACEVAGARLVQLAQIH
ncbi:TPA: hypothetical protein QDB15_000081 [Burkholderia vietnamiensis]|uniref:Uncharacterized protein n=1 Tax=Pandoraea apista TaxID=93218 RepID=A0A5E5P202_9BURK|nr:MULTISPECIES: hypothetical protein [Burkholderiaceae]MCA8206355.1 hypothetical protein [Burkholderia vietnamiensis]VVG70374.1 hypothetical protein PAP18089_01334 [Pandoraea apista]HDR8943153.1 hypothetical protein [Burkholderia vietnamiensis]HDR9116357.1 hypothetical protein [Burkholderia vietnamiensis]HDR9205403.1 hypothetical protein [Burkholderia vietnamiensis]